MKDLDFDELDRAVASALSSDTPADAGTTPTAEPLTPVDVVSSPVSEPQITESSPSISAHAVHSRIMPSVANASRSTLQRKSVMPADDNTVTPTLAPEVSVAATAEPVVATPVAPSPPATRRIPHREGRFMDVVRPGQSTGTSTSRPSAVATPASASDDTSVEVAPEQTPDTLNVEASPETNTSLEAAINELFVSEGHDPVVGNAPAGETGLEIAPEAEATALDSVPEEAPSVDDAPTGDDSVEAIAAELGAAPVETSAPAVSPFLSDAKVEKRPLGGLSDVAESEISEPVSTTTSSVEQPAEEPVAPAPEPENTPIPEELASDLLAIESGAPASESKNNEAGGDKAMATNKVPAGPASIARQYKEQPRTASEDDESGAIFDPQTYQQPIEHPAKKSSGWGWIIAIIIIILLAVGGAVAAWFGGLLPVAL